MWSTLIKQLESVRMIQSIIDELDLGPMIQDIFVANQHLYLRQDRPVPYNIVRYVVSVFCRTGEVLHGYDQQDRSLVLFASIPARITPPEDIKFNIADAIMDRLSVLVTERKKA